MAKPRKPTVSDEFQTEQSAITIFRHLLPAKWILRELQPDFHLDYLVEVVDAGELTGLQLGVQLKGWQRKKNHAGPPKYSLKTKHLEYYIDKCTIPVFLVLVDVAKQTAHWVFMQKFGRERNQEWRKQKRITVEFNETQTLSDHAAFIAAVREAARYTRDLHPGSVKAALSHAEKELAAKDERVAVKIDVIDGIQKVTLHPKENFPFRMKFKTADPTTVQNVKDFFEKGSDLKIKSSEIEVLGAPHLEALAKGDGDLLIQHRKELPGHVLLTWNETDVLAHVQVPGRFWAGMKYISCEAALSDAPLQLSATIAPETWNKQEPFSMAFGFRPQIWQGQPLLALAFFDSVYALVKAIRDGGNVTLRFYVKGNIIGTARMDHSALSDISGFWDLLETLRKARSLATRFNVSPVLPAFDEMNNQDFDSIDELYAMVFENGHQMKVPNLAFSATVDRPVPPEAKLDDVGTFAIVIRDETYPLFGTTIKLDRVEMRFSHLKLAKAEPISEGKKTQLAFTGTSESERLIRLAESDTPS
jgi:hypothetical protein